MLAPGTPVEEIGDSKKFRPIISIIMPTYLAHLDTLDSGNYFSEYYLGTLHIFVSVYCLISKSY